MSEVAKLIAQIEGKRKAISIAQVKEVIGIVADLFWTVGNPEALARAFLELGKRRAKSKKAKVTK